MAISHVDRAEFVDYMSRGFAFLDRDGNGVLEGDELPPTRHQVPRTLEAFQADLRRQFDRLDRNRDGWLSPGELARPPG